MISWSASSFLVATVCAAGGTILAASEENIVEKYPEVRWVVRLLSRASSTHIFAGIMLLCVSILLLDSVEDVVPVGRGGMITIRVAGGYALLWSLVSLVISAATWYRYTRPSTFI